MSIQQFIDDEVKSNDVVLFMKGTPQFPQCGFSGQVVQILDHLGVAYKGINVLESDEIREGIKAYAQLADHPAALCEGRIRRRLRHHPRDVPGRRIAGSAEGRRRKTCFGVKSRDRTSGFGHAAAAPLSGGFSPFVLTPFGAAAG